MTEHFYIVSLTVGSIPHTGGKFICSLLCILSLDLMPLPLPPSSLPHQLPGIPGIPGINIVLDLVFLLFACFFFFFSFCLCACHDECFVLSGFEVHAEVMVMHPSLSRFSLSLPNTVHYLYQLDWILGDSGDGKTHCWGYICTRIPREEQLRRGNPTLNVAL